MPEVPTKVEWIQEKVRILEELVGDLEQAVEILEPDDLQEIRRAFFANLSKEWTTLASFSDSTSNSQKLGKSVEDLESFLFGLQQVVSQPRRSRLNVQLKSWISGWSAHRVDWMLFLEPASDYDLDEIGDLMDASEPKEIQDSDVRIIWNGWLEHQVRALTNLEKSGSILRDWLQRIQENFSATLSLDKFVVVESKGYSDGSQDGVSALVVEKWWHGFRISLRDINTRQDELEWDEDSYKRQLGLLRGALNRLAPLVIGLASDETNVVQRVVRSWTEVREEDVQYLASSVSSIRAVQSRDDLGWLDYNEVQISDPPLTCVTRLERDRPTPPRPKRNETLRQYQLRWEDFGTTLDIWKQELVKCRTMLSHEALRSQKLVLKYDASSEAANLADELDSLLREIDGSTTLKEVVQVHNAFIDIRSRLLSALTQQLDEIEADIFEMLLTTLSESQTSLSVTELETDVETEDVLRSLYGLAEKRLISLEVRIGE